MIYKQKWRGAAIVGGVLGECFDVTVPGNIQRDYAEYMGWGDINFMDNCKKYMDIEDCFWSYTTEINVKQNDSERVFFVTDGIEYEYDVIMNGKKLIHHEGMFSRVEIDITDEIKRGSNLEILIYPHPKLDLERFWKTDSQFNISEYRSHAAQSCKPAVGYGWDWHPRVLVSGLWRDTYIETRTEAYINDAEVFYTLSDDLSSADVHFEIDCNTATKIEFFAPDGVLVYSGYDSDFHIDNIKLWWCNGQGEAALYSWRVTSSDCTRVGRVGFKRVHLIMHEGAWDHPAGSPKTRSNPPMTLELNGRVVFAKGSNWVNPEIFTACISDETYITQVDYAKEANMNLLRAWGGAIIDRDIFFDRCDEQGIMVWQEFPLACNNYIDTPSYLRVLEKEAVAIIKRVRRHACHVLWCGGNELFNNWSGMTEQSHTLRLLDKLTYEYDYDKPYIMTSPLAGAAHGYYEFFHRRVGTTIIEHYPKEHYTAYPEFGTPSIADMEQLRRCFTEEAAHDPLDYIEMWELHHGLGAYERQGWASFDSIDRIFGKQKSMEDYIEKSNLLQCVGLGFVFEECRRQKPVCSMALNWCYNEPWITAAGTSIIAYPSRRKPAYYAVRDALRPVLPSARFDHFVYHSGDTLNAELWLLNDTYECVSDTVDVYFTVNGEKRHIMTWETGVSEPNKNITGHTVSIRIPEAETQIISLTLIGKTYGISEYRMLLRNNLPEEKVLYAPKLN